VEPCLYFSIYFHGLLGGELQLYAFIHHILFYANSAVLTNIIIDVSEITALSLSETHFIVLHVPNNSCFKRPPIFVGLNIHSTPSATRILYCYN
jgi:hypothetical protein